MLTLDDVHLTRGSFEFKATLQLSARGKIAVIGPSGGGKSTLLSLIAGFETPDNGRIAFDGTDLSPLPPGERPVAMLFQDNNLFPHLTVETNVALGLEPIARPSDDARKQARRALAQVGLTGQEDKRPGALSGGQQSRAALARVLLTARPVVLLDEAFSALGPGLRKDMLTLVDELLADRLILMVTHDPGDAEAWTDATVFVEDGHVHAPRDTAAFFAEPSESLRRYLD